MLQENKIIELLPQVLSGDRLIEELGYLPAYNETIIEQSQASRLSVMEISPFKYASFCSGVREFQVLITHIA